MIRKMGIWKPDMLSDTYTSKTTQEIVHTFYHISQEAERSTTYMATYSNELALMNCVMNGDLKALEERLRDISKNPIQAGYMSDDPLRQALFSLVSGVTLMTRFAITGGLPEHDAYLLSDAYLQQADKAQSPEQVVQLLPAALRQFTQSVHDIRLRKLKSYPVSRCVRYIGEHLHNRITLAELASHCKVTPQYLSTLFHQETGMTITAYIRLEKLKTATQMLSLSDYSVQTISDLLAFSTPAAFCAQFKKQYGITPLTWRIQNTNKFSVK
ncbi:MAG: AraC family transcriptional regulator [bacterium]|nr:AraC family transcriptional regulator [bacterium]